jgi:hypothetical protein
MFADQIELSKVGAPKAIYNPALSVMSYSVGFCAVLKFKVDLRRFPFDRTILDVPINLRTSIFTLLTECPVEWLPDKWFLRNPFDLSVSGLVSSEYQFCSSRPIMIAVRFSKPTMRILLERIPTHWIQVAVVPSFLIVLLSYQVFFIISKEEVADRANCIVTLILTQIALKFAIANGLPQVPYNTILDSYLVFSVIVLIVAAIMCTLSNSIDSAAFDIIAGVSTSGVWVLVHCIFFGLTIAGRLDFLQRSWEDILETSNSEKLKRHLLDDFDGQIIHYDRDGKEILAGPKISTAINNPVAAAANSTS